MQPVESLHCKLSVAKEFHRQISSQQPRLFSPNIFSRSQSFSCCKFSTKFHWKWLRKLLRFRTLWCATTTRRWSLNTTTRKPRKRWNLVLALALRKSLIFHFQDIPKSPKDGRPVSESIGDTRKETEEILNSILPPRVWEGSWQLLVSLLISALNNLIFRGWADVVSDCFKHASYTPGCHQSSGNARYSFTTKPSTWNWNLSDSQRTL